VLIKFVNMTCYSSYEVYKLKHDFSPRNFRNRTSLCHCLRFLPFKVTAYCYCLVSSFCDPYTPGSPNEMEDNNES